MKSRKTPKFLNVDLEIESVKSLRPLADELGEAVIVLHQGPAKKRGYLLGLESSGTHRGPDTAIHALCSLIPQLSESNRQLWDAARRKVFDVGYELPLGGRELSFGLHPDTIKRIASIGATLGITCYRQEQFSIPSKS